MKESKKTLINMVNHLLKGTTIEEIKKKLGGLLKYPIYMSKEFMETDVTELDLSPRSYNCLKRAGFDRVGILVDNMEGREDLLKIRNLGKKSADEIMTHIFLFQFSLLSSERQRTYLQRVEELNGVL